MWKKTVHFVLAMKMIKGNYLIKASIIIIIIILDYMMAMKFEPITLQVTKSSCHWIALSGYAECIPSPLILEIFLFQLYFSSVSHF